MIINLKNPPKGYKVYFDSIDYYCKKWRDIDSPGLWVIIRKTGFKGSKNGYDFEEIQCFSYNKLPCDSTLIDTIQANSPYK